VRVIRRGRPLFMGADPARGDRPLLVGDRHLLVGDSPRWEDRSLLVGTGPGLWGQPPPVRDRPLSVEDSLPAVGTDPCSWE
jgi:hypothetical protein